MVNCGDLEEILARWHNWSGKVTANASDLHFVRSEADACAVVKQATEKGLTIRTAGATHSHAPLVANDGLIVDARGLSGLISTDTMQQSAWVWAGSRIFSLGQPLQSAGLGLMNQGDIDEQAIAGATATGTHGTGQSLKNLSAAVLGYQLVTADGELVEVSQTQNTEIFGAARQHLGAFGLITRVNLQLREAYRLKEETWEASLDELLEASVEKIPNNRHFEFFWYPQQDSGRAKTINETDEPPVYPIASEGERCAWSHEVLPNYRPHKHTEMEYSVPAEHGVACMQAIRDLLKTDFTDVQWPVEYRTLAADDVWLSTAYERETVTISVHQDVRLDEEAYYRACEEIFLSFAGRPHWGKVDYLSGEALAARHPKWDDWWQIRDHFDPSGTFLNPYLRDIRPQ